MLIVSIEDIRMERNEKKIQFGEYVKEQRERKKLTQEQLAEQTELSTVTISAIERGVKAPSFESMSSIICVLNLDPRRIFPYKPMISSDKDEAYRYYCEIGRDFTQNQLLAVIHLIGEFHKSN